MARGRAGVTSLAALVGVVLLVGCGPSATERLEEQWSELGVPEAEFVFLGDWTDEEQESIRWELKRVQVVLAEHFGAVTSDFTVYVSTELDRPEVRQLGRTCGGGSWDRGRIRIVLEGCSDDYRARGGPLAHEYFHVLQRNAGTINTSSGVPGRWMVEGAAVYAQAIYDDLTGRRRLAAQRELERLSWSASGTGTSVIGDPSEVGFIVTERLVEQTGPEAILEFFRLGGHRAAFTQAFGVDYEVFVAALEVHRLQVAAPFEWRVAGTVFDSAGQPAAGLDVIAVVRIEGESRAAGRGETDSQGEFGFATPGTGYTIAIWLQCHRDDGTVKWVHVGELGEEGFVADDDGVYTEGEEGGVPFGGEDRDRVDLLIHIPTTLAALTAEHCEE